MAHFMTRSTSKGTGTPHTGGGDGGDPGHTGGGGDPGHTGGHPGSGDPGHTGGDGDPGHTGGDGKHTAHPTSPPGPVQAATNVISSRLLNFSIQRQQQSEWCWAAVAASIEKFFNPASAIEQCDIANKVLPKSQRPKTDCGCCCEPEACDQPAELETALKKIHKWRTTLDKSATVTGTLAFDEIVREIDQGRPVCAGISWNGGGGHFVVLRGYRQLTSGVCQVYVADPLNPSSLCDLDEFTSAYLGQGEWTETDLIRDDWD
jgi:hypothetical protein